MARLVQNEFYPDFSVTMALIADIQDASGLRKAVMTGALEATLLNSSMIVDEFQLIVAANQAIHCSHLNKMVTKTLHSEILYRLSPSKNISESFKKFGMLDKADFACVLIVNDKENSVLNQILALSKGKISPFESLSENTNINAIKKVYKISDEELSSGCILDAVVSRIASKDIVTI